MKNFLYASVDGSQTTSSTSPKTVVHLEIPGDPRNPQDWAVIATWNAVADSPNPSLSQYYAEWDDGANQEVFAFSLIWETGPSNTHAMGGFHVIRDLSSNTDFNVRFLKLAGPGTKTTIKNARILAIRIPKDARGTFKDARTDYAASPVGTELPPALVKSGWAPLRTRVDRGRYLVIGSIDIDLPIVSSGTTVSAGLDVYRSIPDTSVAPKSSVVSNVLQVPPELAVSSGVNLRLARPLVKTRDQRHTFFCMGIAELDDEWVDVIMSAETDVSDSPNPLSVMSARTALIPLDGNWEYAYANVPAQWSSDSGSSADIVEQAAFRRDEGQTKTAVRIGYVTVSHDAPAVGVGAEATIETHSGTVLGETEVENFGYDAGIAELPLVMMSDSASEPVRLRYREVGGVSPGSAVFSSGMLLTLVDHQSNQTSVPASMAVGYDCDLSGVKDSVPIDAVHILHLLDIANAGVPVPTLEVLEIVDEDFDRVRATVSDTLLWDNE